jgi:hypothetical protein
MGPHRTEQRWPQRPKTSTIPCSNVDMVCHLVGAGHHGAGGSACFCEEVDILTANVSSALPAAGAQRENEDRVGVIEGNIYARLKVPCECEVRIIPCRMVNLGDQFVPSCWMKPGRRLVSFLKMRGLRAVPGRRRDKFDLLPGSSSLLSSHLLDPGEPAPLSAE